MNDQLVLNIRESTPVAAIRAIKIRRILLVFDPFLNFMENIGISLTSSKARTTDTTGRNHAVCAGIYLIV